MEPHTQTDGMHDCLDMLPVHWISNSGDSQKVCATILEISTRGALLHVDEPVPVGTTMELLAGGTREFRAHVTKVDADQFGYYLTLWLDEAWFPDEYQPGYLRAVETPAAEFLATQNPVSLKTHVSSAI
jgi:hypothetical protein